jgi:hypothetical protein
MISLARSYFETGHSWITFDIDTAKVKCSQFEYNYEYTDLKQIKKKVIK